MTRFPRDPHWWLSAAILLLLATVMLVAPALYIWDMK